MGLKEVLRDVMKQDLYTLEDKVVSGSTNVLSKNLCQRLGYGTRDLAMSMKEACRTIETKFVVW